MRDPGALGAIDRITASHHLNREISDDEVLSNEEIEIIGHSMLDEAEELEMEASNMAEVEDTDINDPQDPNRITAESVWKEAQELREEAARWSSKKR